MRLSRANFYLTLLLLIGVLALFLQTVKSTQSLDFQSRRIDELEKRPSTSSVDDLVPQAGTSGQIDVSALTRYIDQKLATLSATPKIISSPLPTATVASAQPGKKITYLPVYGGGMQTTSLEWVDVPGSDFQFSVSDYGSGSYISWDAVGFVIGGSGEVRMRLYDLTNNVVVPGSEVSLNTPKQSIVTSGKLIFLAGANMYRVQLVSKTSSTVEFDFGRIKVVY
jgi:hypothetical protein